MVFVQQLSVVGPATGNRQQHEAPAGPHCISVGRGHPAKTGSRRSTRPTRLSSRLKPHHERTLIAAAEMAEAMGQPLNRLITVRLEKLGREATLPQDGSQAAAHQLLDKLRRMIEKRVQGYLAIWSREWSDKHYDHIHIALHVPDGFNDTALAQMLARWTGVPGSVSRGSGRVVAKAKDGCWHIGRHVERLSGSGVSMARYITKSASSPDGCGPIVGKRCGTSKALGPTARKRWPAAVH